MDLHVSAYLGVFMDELDEQLQLLDVELLRLEQDGGDKTTISNIFRAAHTLKGSSAAMGFEQMKELTHCIENVFELIRCGELAVDSALITALLQAIDYLKVLKHAILDDTLEQTDIRPYTAALDRIYCQTEEDLTAIPAEASSPEPEWQSTEIADDAAMPLIHFNEFQRDTILRALKEGYHALAVYVRFDQDAAMKSVRALLVYNTLRERGEIIASFPATEDIEDELTFQGSLVYIVLSQDGMQSTVNAMNQLAQIDAFHVTAITPQKLDGFCEGPSEAVGIAAQGFKPAESSSSREETAILQGTELKRKAGPTVRVDVERLEKLLNFVGELIIDNTRLQEFRKRFTSQFKEHEDAALLNDICSHFSRVIGDLQDGMMKTRMLPIEQLFNRFPRLVRDAGQLAGKEIDFVMEGKETELDRTLIEEISDPIIHILRNAADHGIETPEERERLGKPRKGKLVLKAAHQENQIILSIADDGRGIDPQRVKESSIRKGFITAEEADRMTDKELVFLIFRSGLSTADKITDLSGRGVGMDIVRSHIEKLNGIIDIDTSPGEGTVMTIKLPLTLAIIRSLLVKLGRNTFAIPLVNVIEIVRLRTEEIRTVQGREVCVIRGTVFPLIRMHNKMNIAQEDPARNGGRLFVVVIGIADKRVCLIVDRTVGNQEIVIKSLGAFVGDVPYISGSTILGDGNVGLILDVGAIVKEEGSLLAENEAETKQKSAKNQEQQLVTFSLGEEQYALDIHRVKEIITVPAITRIVNAPPAMLGLINLRGALLPVYDLRQCFGSQPEPIRPDSRIIVVECGERTVGILIDQVTEVLKVSAGDIEAAPNHAESRDSRFIRGICRRQDRFVILLDIDRLIRIDSIPETAYA